MMFEEMQGRKREREAVKKGGKRSSPKNKKKTTLDSQLNSLNSQLVCNNSELFISPTNGPFSEIFICVQRGKPCAHC